MRIVMVGSFPSDPDKVPGGVEAVIRNLVVNLARNRDLDLHLVTCDPCLEKEFETRYAGATIHYLKGQPRLGNVTDHFLEQRRIAARIEALEPDLVHAHGTGHHVAAAQRTDYPLVITVHGIRFREVVLFGGFKGWARQLMTTRLEKRVLARARHVFVIAEYVRQAIAGLTRATFYPIANPVDEELFDLETSDDGRTILSVATVQPRKGLIHLVEALALVREKIPEARLQIIGKVLSPAYAEQMQMRIAELGLQEAVAVKGFVTDRELRDAFTGCAVFALCSVEESSPVAIAEAMTLAKPVLATAVGGVPDLVADGQTGFLVPFGDVAATARHLYNILNDNELRASCGRAARLRAEKDFHPQAIAEHTVDVYRRILQTNKETHGRF